MATILNFKPKPPSGAAPRPAGVEAQLILFPGVRYERQGRADSERKRDGMKGALERAKPQF